jgi:hypothetical protein
MKEMIKILDDFFEVRDHLQCGNEKCFYDGQWCYHFTDKDLEELKKLINQYEKN